MSYAKDVLVETDWVAEHLDDESIRIVEVDENPALYAEGHIPGAIGFDWQRRPAGPGRAQLPRSGGLRRADGQPRHLQRPHRRPLRRPQQLVRRLHLLVLPLLRPRQGEAGQRPAREVDRRGARDLSTEMPSHPAATFTAEPGDDSIRAFRDEVSAALDCEHEPGRRAQPAGVLGRADRDGRVRAGGRPARRPHPGRRLGAVGSGGERGRDLQDGRGAARALHLEGSPVRRLAGHRLLPDRRALGPHLVRPARAARQGRASRTTTVPGPSGATSSARRSRRASDASRQMRSSRSPRIRAVAPQISWPSTS